MEEHNRNSNQNSSEDEWSEEESTGSYYSDSDSSVPEWEPSVDDVTGEVLFIDCYPTINQGTPEKVKENLEPFTKTQLRRSTRGKFLKLIRRKDNKRHSRRCQDLDTGNKVKFHDSQEGEEKEVVLKIQEKCNPQGPLAESLLGINVGTLSDGNRVMIAGFLPESCAKHEKNIKIGDWLKSINDFPVTYQNLNDILEKFIDKPELHLKLQRVTGVEVTTPSYQSSFIQELLNFDRDMQKSILTVLSEHPVGVLYLDTDKLSESNPEYDDIIYSFPHPFEKSVLCNSRGIFITLQHLINDVTKSEAKTSSILYKNQVCHVTYNCFENKMLLVMLPDYCGSVKECGLISANVIKLFEFLFESLDKGFTVEFYRSQVEVFLARFLPMVLNGEWLSVDTFVAGTREKSAVFEEVLPAAVSLHLPDEAYMQLDDALTELEASDYREWNEEPLDCQRLFTILGSAYYHNGYLLASHLPPEDLTDIHIYCRQFGFFHLSKTEPIKTLLLWKEVFPSSCKRNTKTPLGKRYLLVVGSKKDLLVSIMEAGGCTEPAEENMGPDAFYVEEVQATLAHIQELGVPELADRLIGTNPGPQVTIPEICGKRRNDFIDTLTKNKSEQKVTSILKRRNSDQNLPVSSIYSLPEEQFENRSEDSSSQSEISRNKYSDSDTDDYDGSQLSNGSFDISELRQTLLSDTDIRPQQLTAGSENALFHYVEFDSIEGILICPPDCRIQSRTRDILLDNFRISCHRIHSLFQHTMRFKNMPAQDMAKSAINKSLIAIKEHGVMFECSLEDTDNKKSKIKYWVIGRLFYVPHPKEVFVCYQDDIPQNLIELAFNIDLSTIT